MALSRSAINGAVRAFIVALALINVGLLTRVYLFVKTNRDNIETVGWGEFEMTMRFAPSDRWNYYNARRFWLVLGTCVALAAGQVVMLVFKMLQARSRKTVTTNKPSKTSAVLAHVGSDFWLLLLTLAVTVHAMDNFPESKFVIPQYMAEHTAKETRIFYPFSRWDVMNWNCQLARSLTSGERKIEMTRMCHFGSAATYIMLPLLVLQLASLALAGWQWYIDEKAEAELPSKVFLKD